MPPTASSLAVPDFVWALAFVLVFGVFWPVFPLSGRIDPSVDSAFRNQFLPVREPRRPAASVSPAISLAHMVMPALALALPLAAIIARILKEALSEAMLQDYVLLARVKGLSELRLIPGRRCATRSGRRWRSPACSSPS